MGLLLRVYNLSRVRAQGPIEAGPGDREWSQPEPDLAVLAEAKPDFRARHPNGDELLLVIEVADSSFRKDATRKRELYANAGVPEYWVLDIDSRRLLVFHDLRDRNYAESLVLSGAELAPHIGAPVYDLLA